MKRTGRRGCPPGVTTGSDEDSLDAVIQTDILKAAGIEAELLEDMSVEERKGTLKAILESNPAILREYKSKSHREEEAQTDTSHSDANSPEREEEEDLPTPPAQRSLQARNESNSDVDDDDTQAPDQLGSAKCESDSDANEEQENSPRVGLEKSQLTKQSSSSRTSRPGLLQKQTSSKHNFEKARGTDEAVMQSLPESPTSGARLVLDSDEEDEETQAYDMENNPILAASTEASPIQCRNRSGSGDIIPESQVADSSPSSKAEDHDVDNEKDHRHSHGEEMDVADTEHITRPPMAASSKDKGDDISLNRIHPKELKDNKAAWFIVVSLEKTPHSPFPTHLNGFRAVGDQGAAPLNKLWPCFYAPNKIKDPARYTQVIKLMFDIYICRLQRTQLRMKGNLKEWGKPVTAGPHIDGCLIAKVNDDAAGNTEGRGGRSLRSGRLLRVNEVLMRNARNNVQGTDDDRDDFESSPGSLGRRSLRTREQIQFVENRLQEKRMEIAIKASEEGMKRKEGLRRGNERIKVKNTLDEEDARDLFIEEASESDHDDADEWLPPKQKITAAKLALQHKDKLAKRRTAENVTETEKKGRILPIWLGKRPKPNGEDGKRRQDEILDSDEEEQMIYGKKRKPGLRISEDKHSTIEHGHETRPRLSNLSLHKRYKWSDDDDDDDNNKNYLCTVSNETGLSQKLHGHTTSGDETKQSLSMKRQTKPTTEGEKQNVEAMGKLKSRKEVFTEVVMIHDDDSSNEKADLEETDKVNSDGEECENDVPKHVPSDGAKSTSSPGPEASQKVTSGMTSSQSSESMLDVFGNLYSTQLAHKSNIKDVESEGQFLSKREKRMKMNTNQRKEKESGLFSSAIGFRGKNERKKLIRGSEIKDSEIKDSQTCDYKSLNTQTKIAGYENDGKAEQSNTRRATSSKTSVPGSSKRKDGDELAYDQGLNERINSRKRVVESEERRRPEGKSDDVYEFGCDSDSQDPSKAHPVMKKRKLLSSTIASNWTSNEAAEENDAPQEKRRVEWDDNVGEKLEEQVFTHKRIAKIEQAEEVLNRPNVRHEHEGANEPDPDSDGPSSPGISSSSGRKLQEEEDDVQETDTEPQGVKPVNNEAIPMGVCPICNVTFQLSELEAHASSCGEEMDEIDQDQPNSRCLFCKKEIAPHSLKIHQAQCAHKHDDPPAKRVTRSRRD